MAFDINKIDQSLTSIIESIELLENQSDEIKKIKHSTPRLQKEIEDLRTQIIVLRNNHQQNKYQITYLSEKDYLLQSQLDIANKLFKALEKMNLFIQKHDKRSDILKKLTDLEMKHVYFVYQLNNQQVLSKIRPTLVKFIDQISSEDLIDFINFEFKLSGEKRFYLENSIIKSKYCRDLRLVINRVLDKSNFSGLIKIVNETLGPNKSLKPILILQTIISYYNKRSIK